MNQDQNYKLETAFGKYQKNPSPSKMTPNFFDLGFGNPDPFNRPKNRLNSSPLKVPLDNAINKVVANINRSPSGSRISMGYSNYISPRNQDSQGQSEDDQIILDRLHPEALEFLQKHFSGLSTKSIEIQDFIDKLMQEFSNLWTDAQARAVLPQFVSKLAFRLGYDNVQLWRLQQLVKDNGIIGLILSIFKELKAQKQNSYSSRIQSECGNKYPQSQWGSSISSPPEVTNLKNIIQQFTEGLAKTTENQIYSKLNGEMRKLVMKYNDAQSLLKQVNQRINQNIDKISYGAKKNELQRNYQNAINRLNDRVKKLQNQLQRQKINRSLISTQNTKLLNENKRLNEVVDKFQNHIIKTQEQPKSKLVMIPPQVNVNGIADDKSRIISTKILAPVQQAFGKMVPVSPLRQTNVSNVNVSRIRGDKQNNVMLNTATIIHKAVTPTKQRVVQVSPSKARK